MTIANAHCTSNRLVGESLAGAVPVGRFHAWWRGDRLPVLTRPGGLSIEPAEDVTLLSELSGTSVDELQGRGREGHRPWLARIHGDPVAWGWCATRELAIGELGLACTLPPGNRYLWDFLTLPPWRGHGIYPSLLQTIIASDPEGKRYWVGHDMPNVASARGIANAGFQEIGVVYRLPEDGLALVPSGSWDRAEAAAALFGIALCKSTPEESGGEGGSTSGGVQVGTSR